MLAALDPCHILVLHCQHCSYMTLTISKLYEHYLTHNCASECCLYQCSQCGIVGTHRNLLEEHCNAWHLNVEVTIKEISKSTLNTDHNYNPKGRKCIFCEFRSTNDATMHQHYTQTHNVYNVGSDVEPQYEPHTVAPPPMPVPPTRAPPVGMHQPGYPPPPPAPDIPKMAASPQASPQKRPFQPVMRRDITRLGSSSVMHRRRGAYRPSYPYARGVSSASSVAAQLPRQDITATDSSHLSSTHSTTLMPSVPLPTASVVSSSALAMSAASQQPSSTAAVVTDSKDAEMGIEPSTSETVAPSEEGHGSVADDSASKLSDPQALPAPAVSTASEPRVTPVGQAASEADDDVIVIKEESDNEDPEEKPTGDFMPITISQLSAGADAGDDGEFGNGYNYDFAQVSGSFNPDSSFEVGGATDMYPHSMETSVGGESDLSGAGGPATYAGAGPGGPTGDPLAGGVAAGAQQPVRRFRCSQCPFAAIQRQTLVDHYYSHASERRYSCARCGSTYKLRHTLDKHMRAVHGVWKRGRTKRSLQTL